MDIENYIEKFKTKSQHGFNRSELKEVQATLKSNYPNSFSTKKFYEAAFGDTGIVEDGEFISYPHDVLKMARCGIQNRDIRFSEFD